MIEEEKNYENYDEMKYIFPEGVTSPTHRNIYILSDATASTCEAVLISCLCQFKEVSVTIHKIPDIKNREQLHNIFKDASINEGIVIYTFVSPDLTESVFADSLSYAVPAIDVLGPIFSRLENLLKLSPMGIPGLLRKTLDNEYFKRITAIDFGVKHDDGLGLDTVNDADIVILGVSRSSKTPISIYLSYRGIKVANYPLVNNFPIPEQIMNLPPDKLFGLNMESTRLLKIRENRFKGTTNNISNYLNLHEIEQELEYAKKIYRILRCPVIDVTLKSIEEAATEIINILRSRGNRPI